VLALHDRLLARALDVQIDAVVTAERGPTHGIAEAREALTDPVLEVLGRDDT
jgi:hypothetical protein